MKIETALNEYFRDCEHGITIEKKAPATIRNSKCTLKLFLTWFPITEVDEITEALLRNFFREGENKRNWKPLTIISHRKNISAFIEWSMHKKRGYLTENPLKEIKKPKSKLKRPRFYTKDQMQKVLHAIDRDALTHYERVRNTTMFNVLFMTGVRRGELLNLRIKDINFETKHLIVRAETSKTRQERAIPLPMKLIKVLWEYLEVRKQFANADCQYLWVSLRTGDKLSDHGLKHITGKLSQAVGFPVRPHSFRHSCATYAYADSRDILSVQKLLGHQEITTTMIYTTVLDENTREVVELSSLNDLL